MKTEGKPALPNGKKATTEQMLEGKDAVDRYMANTEQFLACLREEEKAMGEAGTETKESMKARLKTYNGAVDDMQEVAEAFNKEIKEYKAQKPSK